MNLYSAQSRSVSTALDMFNILQIIPF